MAKILLSVPDSVVTGKQISFIAPEPSASLIGACLVINDVDYTMVDAMETDLTGTFSWSTGAIVSVILNVESRKAYVQNASNASSISNAQIEEAVEAYMQEHPIDIISDEQIEGAISKYMEENPITPEAILNCHAVAELVPNITRYALVPYAGCSITCKDFSLFPSGYCATLAFYNTHQLEEDKPVWSYPIETSILKDTSDDGMPLTDLTVGSGNDGFLLHIYKVVNSSKFNWYVSTGSSVNRVPIIDVGDVTLTPDCDTYILHPNTMLFVNSASISKDGNSVFPEGYYAKIIYHTCDLAEKYWDQPIETDILKDVSDTGMPLTDLTLGIGIDGIIIHVYSSESGKFNWYLSNSKSVGDSVPPTISVTDIEGGHRVTVEDAEGEQSFDVKDGKSGVYVGEGEPEDDSVTVWVNPNGEQSILNSSDLPKVFFSGNANPMTKENPVELDISYRSDTENFDGYVEIKWQGSSSIAYPKKNYTVKMFNKDGSKLKKSFFGWGKQNKYCLKANYVDATHARNIISARLWGDVVSSREDYDSLPAELRTSPNNGAIDGFPIKLYMNGVYQGIYTWNIPKDDWLFNMDKDNPLHNVLCAEINTGAPHTCNFNVPWSGIDEDGWSYEVGEPSADVTNSLNELINCVMNCPDETFKEAIALHLDVQSAIDYYIHQLVIYGKDNMAKNMLLATYDLTKWFMSAYDMDSTFGMEWDGSKIYPADTPIVGYFNASNSLLWQRISTLFAEEISAKYAELRKTIYTVPNMVTMFEKFMDSIGKDLYAEDLEVFPDIPSAEITNIKQIREFISGRLVFLDKQLLPPAPVYQLRNTTVFDGTNYIDTGIDLDSEKEYTVLIDYAVNELPLEGRRGMLIDRYNPYMGEGGLGWGLFYSPVVNGVGVPYGGTWANSPWLDFSLHDWDCTDPVERGRNRCFIRKKDGVITLSSEQGQKNVNTSDIKDGETGLYVTLGAKCWVNQDNGQKGYDNFIKATMYDCRIYTVALSDEECNAYIRRV